MTDQEIRETIEEQKVVEIINGVEVEMNKEDFIKYRTSIGKPLKESEIDLV